MRLSLARFLAEEQPSSVAMPSSPLPMSTPIEPKAMTLARSRQLLLEKGATKGPRHITSKSPPPVVPGSNRKARRRISSPARSAKHLSSNLSSPNSIVLPKRSRKRVDDHLSYSPAAKRQDRREYTPSPTSRARKRARNRNDHWSPSSSRAPSPIRSSKRIVQIPAAKWYGHLKTGQSTPFKEELQHRLAKPKLDLSMPGEQKYPSSESIMTGSLDEEIRANTICYNCGKKGHWFMDCKRGCGKCGGDGHVTIDCIIIRPRIGLGNKRDGNEKYLGG